MQLPPAVRMWTTPAVVTVQRVGDPLEKLTGRPEDALAKEATLKSASPNVLAGRVLRLNVIVWFALPTLKLWVTSGAGL